MQYCVTLRVWPNSHGYCCSNGRRSHITPLRGHIRYWHLVYCKVVGHREEGQQPANCPPDKQLLKRKEIHTIKVSESKNKLQHTVTTVAVVEGGSGVLTTTVLKTGRSVSLNLPLRGQATQQ